MRGDTGQPRVSRFGWVRVCLVCAAAVTSIAQDSRPASTPDPATTAQSTQSEGADAKVQPAKDAGHAPAIAEGDRKKQIADESTQLLSMALALKAEVDKTTKDTLSMNVIRKADEIEKLAHTVKEKTKQTGGAS